MDETKQTAETGSEEGGDQKTVESYGSLKTEQYFEISDVRPTRS